MNRSRTDLTTKEILAAPSAKTLTQEDAKLCLLCGTLNHRDNVECWTCRWHGGFDREPGLVGLAWQRLESQYEEVRLEHLTSRKMRALGDFGALRPRSQWQTLVDNCRARWAQFQAQRDLRMAKRRASLRSQSSRSSGLGV